MPISLTPIAWAIVAASVLTAGYFIFDAIGDRREAQVWAKINAKIAARNIEIREGNTLDDNLAALEAGVRAKALADAGKAKGDKHPASKEQALALSRVK